MNKKLNEIKRRALFDALKVGILGNKYVVDCVFPIEAQISVHQDVPQQISRKFKVSWMTDRKAFDVLHHEGCMRIVKGCGTFVTRQGAMPQRNLPIYSDNKPTKGAIQP